MKKLVYVSTLFGIVALIIFLVVGSAAATLQVGAGEIEPEIEPEPGGSGPRLAGPSLQEDGADPEDDPEDTAVRLDFEVSGHKARRGLYVLQEVEGDVLASWYAMDGWTDSGWYVGFDLASESIYVEVLYYPGPDTEPTTMRILNHAPEEEYGWMSRGIAHAIEIAWP